MSKAKKTTVGERIAELTDAEWDYYGDSSVNARKALARRIDAAMADQWGGAT